MPKRPNAMNFTQLKALAIKKGYDATRMQGTMYIVWSNHTREAASTLAIETLSLKPDYVAPTEPEKVDLTKMDPAERDALILKLMNQAKVSPEILAERAPVETAEVPA